MASSYNRYSLAALGTNPAKKEVVVYVGGLILAVFLIVTGSFLIIDEKTIKDLDSTKTSTLNNTFGIIQVVVGSLVVLYLIFRFFTK